MAASTPLAHSPPLLELLLIPAKAQPALFPQMKVPIAAVFPTGTLSPLPIAKEPVNACPLKLVTFTLVVPLVILATLRELAVILSPLIEFCTIKLPVI